MQKYNVQQLFERSGIVWENSELYEVISQLKLTDILSRDFHYVD